MEAVDFGEKRSTGEVKHNRHSYVKKGGGVKKEGDYQSSLELTYVLVSQAAEPFLWQIIIHKLSCFALLNYSIPISYEKSQLCL